MEKERQQNPHYNRAVMFYNQAQCQTDKEERERLFKEADCALVDAVCEDGALDEYVQLSQAIRRESEYFRNLKQQLDEIAPIEPSDDDK